VVALNKSVINGTSSGTPVPVIIEARSFLFSNDSQILSNAPTFTIDTNFAASLAPLIVNTQSQQLVLPASCAEQSAGKQSTSSFGVSGRDGLIVPSFPRFERVGESVRP
jgi:hypothetical protein